MIAVYLLILFLLFMRTKQNNRKIVILSYNYFIAFVIYLILSNFKQPPLDYKTMILNILNSVYYAVKGIAFDRSFQQYRDVFHMLGNEQLVEIQIWGILLIASLSMTLIVVSVLLEDKINTLKLNHKYKKQDHKIIIVGNNINSHALINDVLNTQKYKDSVIAYYTEDIGSFENKDNVIIRHLDDLTKDNPLVNGKGEYFIVIALSDKNKNMEWLGKLLKPINDEAKRLQKARETGESGESKYTKEYLQQFHITVVCNNQQLRFNNWEGNGLDIYLISEENLVINKIMTEHSPLQTLLKNKKFNKVDNFNYITKPYSVCVIGFGDLGVELLLSSFENSRFINENMKVNPLNALVIDESMDELKEGFLTDVTYFKDKNDVKFVGTKIGTENFYEEIKMRINELDHIFLSTGDNMTNINTALKLSHFIKYEMGNPKGQRPEITIFIRNEKYSLEPLILSNDMLSVISICDDIYTFDNLILKDIDNMAKIVHDNYNMANKKAKQKIKTWNELDIFGKSSNRASAGDKNNKLTLANLKIDEQGNLIDINSNAKVDSLDQIDDLLWKLAVYEHYRWSGFHYARGYRRLMPYELTAEDLIDNNARHEHERKHLCLVDWDELNTLPCQMENKKFQHNDYNSVVSILSDGNIKINMKGAGQMDISNTNSY